MLSSTIIAAPVGAAAPELLPTPGDCVEGILPSGARSLICVPASGWNGDLVVWGHGYVPFNEPLDFYHIALDDGTYLPTLIQSLGYAFATTSYRQNGLAIVQGVGDVQELVAAFRTAHPEARRIYMVGASEGGLITALLAERAPAGTISGALSLCGPVGDWRRQVDYLGDFRVLFDYFFPGVLPPTAISIPDDVIAGWDSIYKPAITGQVAANTSAARQLISTSKAAVNAADPSTIVATAQEILWYNVFATNDATSKLGGNPFDNRTRWYYGSSNDLRLNSRVVRYTAAPAALTAMQAYNTSGVVRIPMVTMHTTGDPVVPFWHQTLYLKKLWSKGSFGVTQVPIARYGHCNFNTTEVLAGFGLLVLRTTGVQLENVPEQYDVTGTIAEFERAQAEFASQEAAEE